MIGKIPNTWKLDNTFVKIPQFKKEPSEGFRNILN
jgi:hypothetical protein